MASALGLKKSSSNCTNVNEILQNVSKVVSLGRRNATVPEGYSIDQKAEEESGRLEQLVVGTEIFFNSFLFLQFVKYMIIKLSLRVICVTKCYTHWS